MFSSKQNPAAEIVSEILHGGIVCIVRAIWNRKHMGSQGCRRGRFACRGAFEGEKEHRVSV